MLKNAKLPLRGAQETKAETIPSAYVRETAIYTSLSLYLQHNLPSTLG